MRKNDAYKENAKVNLGKSYNPYEDENLTETQSESSIISVSGNEPLNDAIKYENLVAGRQRNRTISDYSSRQRRWVRLSASSILILFILGMVWDLLR